MLDTKVWAPAATSEAVHRAETAPERTQVRASSEQVGYRAEGSESSLREIIMGYVSKIY
jgi:hypothetical protein